MLHLPHTIHTSYPTTYSPLHTHLLFHYIPTSHLTTSHTTTTSNPTTWPLLIPLNVGMDVLSGGEAMFYGHMEDSEAAGGVTVVGGLAHLLVYTTSNVYPSATGFFVTYNTTGGCWTLGCCCIDTSLQMSNEYLVNSSLAQGYSARTR